MIRMGRSSRTEQSNEPVNSQQQEQEQRSSNLGSLNPSVVSNQTTSRGAISESELIARDIKEGRLSGYVGSGTVLTGETNFQSMLRVDGHLTGRVMSEDGTLIVGSTGQIDANVMVAAAVINGTINGDVIATERVELGRLAHIMGNIYSPRLVVEDGALLEGNCSMIKAREAIEKRRNEANARVAEVEITSLEPAETSGTNDYVQTGGEENEEPTEIITR
ncbi:MAG: polymer-forming cytoskeletal protein [Acidobacteriota bacterium]|jgi:cytoskeletal protein CcmA (bactofilin family)|nr:polymer-forming cytoskeletal protein [Acidobacteriota bacterium]MDQ3375060.1 polymer-forming cytoskeletal protein [Acidobacteriota bacterium]